MDLITSAYSDKKERKEEKKIVSQQRQKDWWNKPNIGVEDPYNIWDCWGQCPTFPTQF